MNRGKLSKSDARKLSKELQTEIRKRAVAAVKKGKQKRGKKEERTKETREEQKKTEEGEEEREGTWLHPCLSTLSCLLAPNALWLVCGFVGRAVFFALVLSFFVVRLRVCCLLSVPR